MKPLFFWGVATAVVFADVAWGCAREPQQSFLGPGGGMPGTSIPEPVFVSRCLFLLGHSDAYPECPDGWRMRPDREIAQETVTTDLAEFTKAIEASSNKDKLLQGYGGLRQALLKHALSVEQARQQHKTSWPPPFSLQEYEETLREIPREFSLYMQGAVAFHNSDYKEAVRLFGEVLRLPKEGRAYRTVWAEYMLGKSLLREDPAQAIACFERTRALVGEGFSDPLNLALESIGWQACAEVLSKKYPDAIHHYFEYGKDSSKAPIACTSLAFACTRAVREDSLDEALVHDSLCRELVTLSVMSENMDQEKKWSAALALLEPAGVIPDADRLAWMTYNAGDMMAAERWLTHAAPDAPFGQWVRAHLLLRSGKLEEGSALMQQLASTFPSEGGWLLRRPARSWIDDPPISAKKLLTGQLAFSQFRRGKYEDALLWFIQGCDSEDALHLAERAMTLDELRHFVDTRTEESSELPEGEEQRRDPADEMMSSVRTALARRLAREGHWAEASAYYTTQDVRPWLNDSPASLPDESEEVADCLAIAQDMTRPAKARAEQFIEAATIVHEHGDYLMGTYWDPGEPPVMDSFKFEEFAPGLQQRLRDSARYYPRRNYVRYYPTELLWQAAELLPNNDPMAARALYLGGTYLMKKDPKAADRFYKALVRRNPNLLVARQADKRRWFPKEFTDTVTYRPRPWYASKRRLAVNAGVPLAALVLVAAGAVFALRRRKTPAQPSSIAGA